MKANRLFGILFFTLSLFSSAAHADTSGYVGSAIIQEAGVNVNAWYYLYVKNVTMAGCDGGGTLMFINASAPYAKAAFATILAAKMTGQPVFLSYTTDGKNCWLSQVGSK